MSLIEGLASGRIQIPKATHACPRCGEGCYREGLCPICVDADRKAKDDRERIRARLYAIPNRYRDASFQNLDVLRQRVHDFKAIEVARVALDGHTVVTLMGKAGAGKSTLAGAILRQCAESGRDIWWSHALRLACVRGESRLGEEPKEIENAKAADVTVIDDLGAEAVTAHSAIVDVIHSRHDDQAATIITTGLDRTQLGAKYGGGLARRILEGANVIEVAFRSA